MSCLARREATAVPACLFGTAALCTLSSPSSFPGKAGAFEATPSDCHSLLSAGLIFHLPVIDYRSHTHDVGGAADILGQLYTLQLPGESELGESLNLLVLTQTQRHQTCTQAAAMTEFLHRRPEDLRDRIETVQRAAMLGGWCCNSC